MTEERPGWMSLRGVRSGLIFAGISLILALFFLWQNSGTRVYTLRMTGGDALGRRHTLAKMLSDDASPRGLHLSVEECSGSTEALNLLQRGKLDVALVQGGLVAPPNVRLVAALNVEPLHLLVKREIVKGGVNALRGRRVNLSAKGSGTRQLASQVCNFVGLTPGEDFQDEDRPYTQLEALSYDALPDGIFIVSSLPSSVADFLVRKHGYQFVPLPFGEALALREAAIFPSVIPAYTHGVLPAEPLRDIPTVGTRLLLVARDDVPDEAVRRLAESVFQSGFLFRANLASVDEKKIHLAPEMPIHPGAADYSQRNDPFLTAAAVQSLESLRSLIFSLVIGFFFLWRWNRQRRFEGFDRYIAEVTTLEKQALALETEAKINLHELIRIRNRLSELKTEALEKFADGRLRGGELMTGFLAHVADVRNYLTALIHSERERIAEQVATEVPDVTQDARFQQEWREALGEAGFP